MRLDGSHPKKRSLDIFKGIKIKVLTANLIAKCSKNVLHFGSAFFKKFEKMSWAIRTTFAFDSFLPKAWEARLFDERLR